MSNWRNLFAQRIYERGRDYYYRDKVKNLIIDEDDNFSAIVEGSRAYKVTGRYHNGKFSNVHCDCPYAQDNHRCKHMAAVLEAIDGGDLENVEPQKSLGEVLQSAFLPNRLPVDPLSFLGNEFFPLRVIEHVFTNLDDVQIISEILIKAADAYFTIPGAKWNYSVAGRFKQYYFSVLVAFNREMIVDVQVDFIKTREGQQIAKMVALYYLLKYLDQHNIEENTNEAARQMLANFLDRDPDSQTIITANIGEYYDGGQYLYFRAGVPDHMYKFPNLTTLTNGIARGERLHLGKFFDQQIIPENLDKDSKQWLDLITKLSSTADLTRDGYYEASVKNELPLASVIMDEVDQILKTGNTLYNRWKVPIKREERALKAAVSIKANGADDDPSRYLDVSVDLPADLIRGRRGDFRRVGVVEGGVYLQLFAVGLDDVVNHVGRGGDEVQIVLPLQPFHDDLHVQQPQEAAAEPEAKGDGVLLIVGHGGVVQLQLFQRVAQIAVLAPVGRIDAGKDHRLGRLVPRQRLGSA